MLLYSDRCLIIDSILLFIVCLPGPNLICLFPFSQWSRHLDEDLFLSTKTQQSPTPIGGLPWIK